MGAHKGQSNIATAGDISKSTESTPIIKYESSNSFLQCTLTYLFLVSADLTVHTTHSTILFKMGMLDCN